MKSSLKSAVVVGGSNRTGYEIVENLLKDGYKVLTTYNRDSSNLEKLDNGNLVYTQLNLLEQNSINNFIELSKKELQKIDLLITVTGVYQKESFIDSNTLEFNRLMQTNTFYVDTIIKNLIDNFNDYATLITFGYSHCDKIVADINKTYYHIAKTSLLLLTKAYAKLLADRHISVNMISPGYLKNSDQIIDKDSIPMKDYGTTDEIYEMIKFLSKKSSKYITGNNIIVSGGYNI